MPIPNRCRARIEGAAARDAADEVAVASAQMTATFRSRLDRRRYRLAQAVTVAGSLALGALVVDRLMGLFREDIFLYYGVSDQEYAELEQIAAARLPVTVGQMMVVAMALVGVCGFVWSERRRVRQTGELGDVLRGGGAHIVDERLSARSMFDAFVLRTSTCAGVLLAVWLLQSSAERWLAGFGWGLQYADWRSLLPIASVFGLCVLAGMLVAAASLVGLRAISVLQIALARVRRRRIRDANVPLGRERALRASRTIRELIGCDILSRPPPLAA